MGFYIPIELEQATLSSGEKIIGVRHKGEFIALNKIVADLMDKTNATKCIKFVEHIKNHLTKEETYKDLKNKEVVCKICDKTIDEISKEK